MRRVVDLTLCFHSQASATVRADITASVAKSRCTAANSSEGTLECARLVSSRCSRANGGANALSQVSASCSARFPPSQLLIHPPLPRQICTGNANNSINATTSVNQSLDHSSPPQSPVRSGSQELALEGHLDQSLPPPQFTSSPAKNSASEALSLILDEVGSRGGVADRRHVVSTSPPFSVKYAWETTFSLLSQEVEEEEEEDSAVVSPGVLSQPSSSSQLFGHAGGGSGSFLSKKHRRMSKSLPNFSGRENASISSGSPGFLGSPLKDPSNPCKPIIPTELNAIIPELYSAFRPLNTSSSACDCFSDGDEDELSDLSSDNSRSANLSELAAVLRLPPTVTKVIQEIFREGTEVHHWLSKLEDSLYQSLPPVTCSEQAFSHAYCRVQHDIPRRELDKCLSELEFYRQQLEGWREDLNNLMTSQRERFEKLSRDNQKLGGLLLSGPSSLNFVSDWLDMLILRRTAVERELNCQLRWLDLMSLAEHDARVRFREMTELAGPALKESRRLIFELLMGQKEPRQATRGRRHGPQIETGGGGGGLCRRRTASLPHLAGETASSSVLLSTASYLLQRLQAVMESACLLDAQAQLCRSQCPEEKEGEQLAAHAPADFRDESGRIRRQMSDAMLGLCQALLSRSASPPHRHIREHSSPPSSQLFSTSESSTRPVSASCPPIIDRTSSSLTCRWRPRRSILLFCLLFLLPLICFFCSRQQLSRYLAGHTCSGQSLTSGLTSSFSFSPPPSQGPRLI
ncbi:hypothetical protein SprV_0401440800 [Sparganum proliferum]